MMLSRPQAVALGLVLAFGFAHAASDDEQIYACRDDDGNIVYQNDPCVEPPPTDPAVSKPGAAPKDPAPSPAHRAPAVRPTASSWKVVPRSNSIPPGPKPTFARQVFPIHLDSVSRAKAPNFDSPAQTWRTFLAGIEGGDRDAVVDCLTRSALDRLALDAEPIPVAKLQEMVGSFLRIEDEGHLGPFWSIYGVRANRRPKWIFFEKTDRGEWKISGI